ncbi:hypothetical protein K501DRAFT_338019 [Backusella circina FSU 941]|nr:hypothetical protein K501DRAFT_338019 [Backusella circina FSU 941]
MLQDNITLSTKESSSLIPPFSSKTSNAKASSLQSEDQNSVSVISCKKPLLTVPIIEQNLSKDDIIKQGLVLCTRIEEWYKTTSKNIVDVELRKRKQRWRQFQAILTKDRLELYHITTTKIKRRAHMIELGGKYGHARLSILSPIDYIWGLEYLHTKKGRPIAFHFQSSHLSDAQDWYMTLHQLLFLPKTKMIGKAPLPPFVDIIIPEMEHFVIHIPLDALVHGQQTSNVIYNIRMHDLKLIALGMLEYKGITPSHWLAENVSLCWTLESHTEWVTEEQNILLVGPQLIEQKHKLELRYLGNQQTCSLTEPCLDGLLKPWKWNDEAQTAVDQNSSEIYAILAGHFLFQVDISHYHYKSGMETSKKSWLSSANGLLQKNKSRKKREQVRHHVQSTSTPPHLVISSPEVEPRRAFTLKYAKQMLDLSKVERVGMVENSKEENNLFRIDLHGGYTLCYETDTAESMTKWIRMLVREQRQYDGYRSEIAAALKAESHLWHVFCRHHQIIKSGGLYVNNNKLFNKIVCILTNEKELLLYNRFKRKRWNSEPIPEPLYRQNCQLKLDDNVYVYSGSECLSDQQGIVKRQQVEPARHFIDGLVTERMRPSDCYFVIWFKTSKSRFVYTRDCISLFKTGHHLGEPGRYLVFKTRNKIERDSWVWALHQEYGC